MARHLPPRRPTTAQSSSTRSPGSVGRPVRLWNIARSSSSSASPIVAIKQNAPGAPVSPASTLPSSAGSDSARRIVMGGLAAHGGGLAVVRGEIFGEGRRRVAALGA